MKTSRAILVSIILFGVGLRILYSTMSVDVSDAYFNLVNAKTIHDCFSHSHFWNLACLYPPVDSFGMSKIFRPFGGTIFMAFFMPYPIVGVILAGTLLILITYAVSRKLGLDVEASLFASAAVSVIPLTISLSSTHSIDTFNGLYLLLAFYFFLLGRTFWTALFSSLGILTSFVAVMFSPAPAIMLFKRHSWRKLILYCGVMVFVVFPTMVYLWSAFANPFYPYFEPLFGHGTVSAAGLPANPVGHSQSVVHYILGLPLSLFGVPEGNHLTVLTIAMNYHLPQGLVWAGFGFLFLVSLTSFYGMWRLRNRLAPDHRQLVAIILLLYGFFYGIRLVYPIGSDVLDLRYFLFVLPFIGMGLTTLRPWIKWGILALFFLGSLGLYARFAMAEHAFEPYAEALDAVSKLPPNAVILSDSDSTVFAYGISYKTGRMGFPYLENPANIQVHIPFLISNYSIIKARGPNYLWTGDANKTCSAKPVLRNKAIMICPLYNNSKFIFPE